MSLRRTYLLALFVGLLSWAALAALVYYRPPEPPLPWVALLLLTLATATTTVPLWGRVQQRLTPTISPDALRVIALREGLWAGLFVAGYLLLRVSGLLDSVLLLVLLTLFVLLENFFQGRSRSESPTFARSTRPVHPQSRTRTKSKRK
ncbi:MAG: hypothetical protein D6775_03120 [Caldilineae bacterium]|nr:MAG: hypothetical protein D6775_03120 [Caldilineae bacterium]